MHRRTIQLRLKATDMQTVANELHRLARTYKQTEPITISDWQGDYLAKIQEIHLDEWFRSPHDTQQWLADHRIPISVENGFIVAPGNITETMRSESIRWGVSISYTPVDRSWLDLQIRGSGITLQRIAHTEYPILLEIAQGLSNEDRLFIETIIDRVTQLWDAQPLSKQAVQENISATPTKAQPEQTKRKRHSNHFAYAPEKREEIVKAFREARTQGLVTNIEAWAKTHYGITGKTLRNYLRESDPET